MKKEQKNNKILYEIVFIYIEYKKRINITKLDSEVIFGKVQHIQFSSIY